MTFADFIIGGQLGNTGELGASSVPASPASNIIKKRQAISQLPDVLQMMRMRGGVPGGVAEPLVNPYGSNPTLIAPRLVPKSMVMPPSGLPNLAGGSGFVPPAPDNQEFKYLQIPREFQYAGSIPAPSVDRLGPTTQPVSGNIMGDLALSQIPGTMRKTARPYPPIRRTWGESAADMIYNVMW